MYEYKDFLVIFITRKLHHKSGVARRCDCSKMFAVAEMAEMVIEWTGRWVMLLGTEVPLEVPLVSPQAPVTVYYHKHV